MAIKSINAQNKTFDISYEIVNPSEAQIIVFLPGWGSTKELMKNAFGKCFPSYKHIYLDMPGFGKSPTSYALFTKDYAVIVKEFLNALDIDDDIIIAGHSFGGKVATLLNPKHLVLLSTAGILETKSTNTLFRIRLAKIFNRFGLNKVTKLLRSTDVNMMSENMYETFKNVVNEDFSSAFATYEGEAMIFWGESDTATTLESGKIIHSIIKGSTFKSYNDDHFFFLRHYSDIEKEILERLSTIKA